MIVATTLDRDDIIVGLRELIAELRAAGEVAGIRLVGGAALSLRHFERGTTQDFDYGSIGRGVTSLRAPKLRFVPASGTPGSFGAQVLPRPCLLVSERRRHPDNCGP